MKRVPGYQRKRPTSGTVSAFLLRLPPGLKTALDAEAAKRGISLAAYVREALAKHLQRAKSR